MNEHLSHNACRALDDQQQHMLLARHFILWVRCRHVLRLSWPFQIKIHHANVSILWWSGNGNFIVDDNDNKLSESHKLSLMVWVKPSINHIYGVSQPYIMKHYHLNFCIWKVLSSVIVLTVPSVSLWCAYRHHRDTDDAISSIVHMVIKHLENPKAYARLLFVDFSSAFNTLHKESAQCQPIHH